MPLRPSIVPIWLAVASGCGAVATVGGKGPMGRQDVPPSPGAHRPVDPTDLDAVLARAQMVAHMDVAVALALETAAAVPEEANGAVVLPVATPADPSGRVVDVRFVRFAHAPRSPTDVADARVVRNVGIAFTPTPRRLQVEILHRSLAPGDVVTAQVAAILAASRALADSKTPYRFHAVLERVPSDTHRMGYVDRVRVYALSAGDSGVDWEFSVVPQGGRDPAQVATQTEVARFDRPSHGVVALGDSMGVCALVRAQRWLWEGAGRVIVASERGRAYRAAMEDGRMRLAPVEDRDAVK